MNTSVIVRGAGFMVLWLALAGAHPGDLPAAVVAVVAATWTSLRLLPPGERHPSPAGMVRLALRFPGQAAIAGIDVARRAFDPRLSLRPGFVTVSSRLPPGTTRDAFCALASLLPGTLPVDATADGRLVWCTASTPGSRWRRRWQRMRRGSPARLDGRTTMADFLVAAAGFILAMVALGLLRILRGPTDADRMMSAQLLGTGGIAALLLLGAGTGMPAVVDAAMTLALLAAFAALAFVNSAYPADEREPARDAPGDG